MIGSFKQYLVEEEKTVYFTLGRLNPPTRGHEMLLDKLAAAAGKNPYRIYLSKSNDPKKNPLSYNDKIKFSRKMFPKHARQILKDNNIKSITYTKVLCVYETIMVDEVCDLVTLENGLKITPWHPILTPLGWKFPSELKSSQIENCVSIITLVLETNHIAFINEHPCITLGHNFKDKLFKHEFYGTEKVVKCLTSMPGFEIGHIKNNSGNIIRDNNGNVINIEYM